MDMPYGSGIPLLARIVDSISEVAELKNVVVATSELKLNDGIEAFCTKAHIKCFRGSEEDVLSRFLTIQLGYQFDYIVRLTGDNPFVDVKKLTAFIGNHVTRGYDYSYSRNLPMGMNFEIVNGAVLVSLKEKQVTPEEKEHVTLHFRNHDTEYKVGLYDFGYDEILSELRLTVDQPADYALASMIWNSLDGHTKTVGVDRIKEIFNQRPWLKQVNEGVIQKKQFKNIEDELNYGVKLLNEFDLKRAAEKLAGYVE
jgi:spore coat polysaccharide biosynthesis protein SpsF